jgi:hypothetical protein
VLAVYLGLWHDVHAHASKQWSLDQNGNSADFADINLSILRALKHCSKEVVVLQQLIKGYPLALCLNVWYS